MSGRSFKLTIPTWVLTMAAAGCGLVFLFACVSADPSDFVGGGVAALQRTQGDADRAAATTGEAIDARIDGFLALFASFDPETVDEAARDAYAEDAYFNDGFAEIEGRDEIAAYLARTAEATAELEVELEDRVVAGGEVYLRWVMRFTTDGRRSRTIVTPGITHLRFDEQGRIVYHRDYWDASGALAEFVPLVGPVIRSVKKRLESE